jgi:hypothetical protein
MQIRPIAAVAMVAAAAIAGFSKAYHAIETEAQAEPTSRSRAPAGLFTRRQGHSTRYLFARPRKPGRSRRRQ